MPREKKTAKALRILAIGAHQDDCEIKVGGTAALWTAAGHTVCLVSATNGATGHHEIGGIELVRRRTAEARAAAMLIGAQSLVLGMPNGELEPSLAYRRIMIGLIRDFKPDLILTHRPNDYHPDHRYTSQLVQDSAYVVTVPNNLPTSPALRHNPVIAYFADEFQKPQSFQPDIVVGIDAVLEKKVDMLHCHVSQMYEWLPFSAGREREVPKGDAERRAWMRKQRIQADARHARQYRKMLLKLYGRSKGAAFQYAEAFESCEYGAPMTQEKRRQLFPFVEP